MEELRGKRCSPSRAESRSSSVAPAGHATFKNEDYSKIRKTDLLLKQPSRSMATSRFNPAMCETVTLHSQQLILLTLFFLKAFYIFIH